MCGHRRSQCTDCWFQRLPLPKCESTPSYTRDGRWVHRSDEALQPSTSSEPQTLPARASISIQGPANADGHPFLVRLGPTGLTGVHPRPPSSAAGDTISSIKPAALEPLTIDPRQLRAAISLATNQISPGPTPNVTPHSAIGTPWARGNDPTEYGSPRRIPPFAAFSSGDTLEEAFSPGGGPAAQRQNSGEPLPLVSSRPGARGSSSSHPAVKIESRSSPEAEEERMFACPFWKLDPQGYRDCVKGKKRVRDVKQHLRRCHSQCPRCGDLIEGEKFAAHLELRPACDMADPNRIEHPRGILPEQIQKLGTRGRDANTDEQWFKVWDIVFPEIARPESTQAYAGTSEDLVSYRQFLLTEGARIIWASLEAGNLSIAILENALRVADDRWSERTRLGRRISRFSESDEKTHGPSASAHQVDDITAAPGSSFLAVRGISFPLDLDVTRIFQGLEGGDAGVALAEDMSPGWNEVNWLNQGQVDNFGSEMVDPSEQSWLVYP